MTSKRVYRVTTAGLDVRDVRLIEIVFKHSQYNKHEFLLVAQSDLHSADLLIANTVEPDGLNAISQLRAASREVPVIAALPRGAVSSTRHAISIDRLTLQLLPILNRVIDLEFGSNANTIQKAMQTSVSPSPVTAAAPAAAPAQLATSVPVSTPPQASASAPVSAPSSPPPSFVAPKSNLIPLPNAIGPDGALIERLRVLVVDDSPTVRQQLAQAFNRMGVISEVAASAKEALDRLAESSFNLALVDVVMPEMDGYKLTKEIKRNKACKQMPVIILTSKSSPFDLARGALAGCDTYLTKPVPLRDLEAAVIKQLRKSLAIDDISGLIRTSATAVAQSAASAANSASAAANASANAQSAATATGGSSAASADVRRATEKSL